jgi:uncharacterized protein YvpB
MTLLDVAGAHIYYNQQPRMCLAVQLQPIKTVTQCESTSFAAGLNMARHGSSQSRHLLLYKRNMTSRIKEANKKHSKFKRK